MQELKGKVTEGLKELLFFNKMCDHPDTVTSDEYFNEIAYNIDLTKLYKVKDVSYYNNKLENAPILLQINSSDLIQQYDDFNYLLQVWDKSNENKFEKSLKGPPKTMVLCYDYLLYIPSDEDEDSNAIHIVDLASDDKNTILIENVVGNVDIKFISYNQDTETLLVASSNELVVVKLSKDRLTEPQTITIEGEDVKVIEFEVKIQGLFLNKESEKDEQDEDVEKEAESYIIFETLDNQLDFNKFIMDFEEDSYKFLQCRELVKRPITGDAIVEIDFVLKDKVVFAIALRKSGELDLYWDMIKTGTPAKKATRVALNHNAYFIEIIDENPERNGDIFTIMTKSGKPEFSQAKRIPKKDFNFDDIMLKKVRQQVKLFTSFQIQQSGHSSVVKIAHGKFVSTFDLVGENWSKHQKYEDTITSLFRTERHNGTEWVKVAAALLGNGQIHYEASEGLEGKILEVKGDIQEIEIDSQNNMLAYIVVDESSISKDDDVHEDDDEEKKKKVEQKGKGKGKGDDDEDEGEDEGEEEDEEKETLKPHKVKVLFREKLYDLNLPGINENSNLCPIKNNEKAPLLLNQQDWGKILVYRINIDEGELDTNEEGEAIGDGADEQFWDFDVDVKHGPDTKYTISYKLINKFKKDKAFEEIGYTITCAATTNINDNVFLFSWGPLYVLDMKAEKVVTYDDQVVIGMQFFDSKEVYGICSDPDYPNLPPGLRLYNLDRIIERKECKGTPVKRIEVGAQDDLEYNSQVNRVGFIQSITDLTLTPLLHRNTMKFFGMQPPEQYIAYKVKNDKLLTLTHDKILQNWNIISGKLTSTHKLSGHDYDQYEVYSKYKGGKVVLISKQDIQDVNENEFFQDWQIQSTVQKQVPYALSQSKVIKEIKVIEIVGPNEIKEHLSFYWPRYTDQQKFYFNDSNEFMIERLDKSRVFLYRVIRQGDTVKWQMVKKLESFPNELLIDVEILNFFSPDFTLHLDINKRDEKFIIKDTLTNQVKYIVPNDLLTYDSKDEDKQETMRRFKWIDERTFIIMNEEGDEKIIDFTNKFVTLASNTVPEIKQEQINSGMYYFGQSKVDISDTLERLKRKYQAYKHSYFLEKKRSSIGLYNNLFTVCPYSFDYTDHSFTFLDWNIIEQFNEQTIDIDNLDKCVIEKLLFNILPGGQTLLHLIADQEEFFGPIIDEAHPEVKNHLTIKYYTPIIPNFEGKTAMHILLELSKNKMANNLLKVMKLYKIDHHSRAIKDIFPEFIKREMNELYPYMESRIQQDHQIQNITKLSLNEDFDAVIESELWFNQEEFETRVEDEAAKFEKNIKLEFIDLPGIYHQLDPQFQDLFDSLAEHEHFTLFNQKLIQKIIDFNYPIVRTYTVRRLFVPFIMFLTLYEIYTNVIYWHRFDSRFYQIADTTFLVLLSLSATYFFANEVKQLIRAPLEYFTSIWNYIDLIPTIGIYTMTALSFLKFLEFADAIFISQIMAITTLFMWFKLLYFLRLFHSTSYLIHMIISVIIDMRHFLLILFITIVAFGDSLLSISLTNQTTYKDDGEQDNGPFTTNILYSIGYTYLMILGGFSTSLDHEGFGQESLYLVWILFILCTIFNMIVMLNLLIAIISESFAKVNSNAEQAAYQVQASLIAENNYLIPQSAKEKYAQQDGYLLMITDMDSDKMSESDPVQEKLIDLKQLIEKQFTEVQSMKDTMINMQTKLERIEVQNGEKILKNLEAIVKAVVKKEEEKKEGEGEKEADE